MDKERTKYIRKALREVNDIAQEFNKKGLFNIAKEHFPVGFKSLMSIMEKMDDNSRSADEIKVLSERYVSGWKTIATNYRRMTK